MNKGAPLDQYEITQAMRPNSSNLKILLVCIVTIGV